MTNTHEQQIIRSWHKNTTPWINAIRENAIRSRINCTNRAIEQAVLNLHPKTLLDLGCGEGWLIRQLVEHGIHCLGIDTVADFEHHVVAAGGEFLQLEYEHINTKTLPYRFDVVACNFSLLGKESVEHVINNMPERLNPGGRLVIQTLHPVAACPDAHHEDGWRKGSWQGFSEDFVDPPPWYFRTLESWHALLQRAGFNHIKQTEPTDRSGKKQSIIFTAWNS